MGKKLFSISIVLFVLMTLLVFDTLVAYAQDANAPPAPGNCASLGGYCIPQIECVGQYNGIRHVLDQQTDCSSGTVCCRRCETAPPTGFGLKCVPFDQCVGHVVFSLSDCLTPDFKACCEPTPTPTVAPTPAGCDTLTYCDTSGIPNSELIPVPGLCNIPSSTAGCRCAVRMKNPNGEFTGPVYNEPCLSGSPTPTPTHTPTATPTNPPGCETFTVCDTSDIVLDPGQKIIGSTKCDFSRTEGGCDCEVKIQEPGTGGLTILPHSCKAPTPTPTNTPTSTPTLPAACIANPVCFTQPGDVVERPCNEIDPLNRCTCFVNRLDGSSGNNICLPAPTPTPTSTPTATPTLMPGCETFTECDTSDISLEPDEKIVETTKCKTGNILGGCDCQVKIQAPGVVVTLTHACKAPTPTPTPTETPSETQTPPPHCDDPTWCIPRGQCTGAILFSSDCPNGKVCCIPETPTPSGTPGDTPTPTEPGHCGPNGSPGECGPEGMVDICHNPTPANNEVAPGLPLTQSVSAAAVPAHLGHGDSLGPCPGTTSTPTSTPSETSTSTPTGMCILNVCKVTFPHDAQPDFVFSISPEGNPLLSVTAKDGECKEVSIPKGVTTTVTEIPAPEWSLRSISCSTDNIVKGTNSVSFKCNDDFAVCTFINEKPTPTPTPTNTPTNTPINTPGPTATFTPVPTDTPVPTATFTPVPTNTPVPTATFTPVPTNTPVPTATPTLAPTSTPTTAPTSTSAPTSTPSSSTPTPTGAAPINNNFASAQTVPTTGTATGSSVGATSGTYEPSSCGSAPSNNGVWYKISVTKSGTLTVNTQSSAFDTVLFLFNSVPTQLLCNDDYSGMGLQSQVSKSVTAGTYYALVSGHNGNKGNIKITTKFV